MPGAWPAQVLIATTSVRLSFPPEARETAETPLEPASREGSGGAFLSALKSLDVTLSDDDDALEPDAPVAHLRTSAPL